MKTRNLLLAGFVAVAMSACSNSEDILDNKFQEPIGEETAMKVSFTVPVSGTRATDDNTQAGDLNESAISFATIVLDYGGSKRIVKDNLTITTNPSETNKDYIATTPEFVVTKGTNVNVYAFINPSNALNDLIASTADLSKLTTGPQVLPSTGLDYLKDGIAKDKNFLMSGVTKGINIEAKKEANEATIEVNRVSAKLEETTDVTKDFPLTDKSANPYNQAKVSVKITDHTYTNLTNISSVMSQEALYMGQLLQEFEFKVDENHVPYRWIQKAGVTYCLENQNPKGTWIKTRTTNVHYKAQVYFNNVKAETFYVKKFIDNESQVKSTIYTSWAAMKEAFNTIPDTDPVDATELKKYDITRYDKGICYYVAPIEHSNIGSTIMRNNWYQLEVTSVKDLGWPTEITPGKDEDARLIVTANIKPWTIHKNNIGL